VIDVNDVLTALPGAKVLHAGPTRFARASVDTRDLTGDELFFAVPGAARDGHDFVGAAARAGASGLVVSRELSELPELAELLDGQFELTVIAVPDTLAAFQATGAAVRQRSTAAVIAITGSAGKTSAKTLIAQVLAAKFEVLSNRASFNNHLGVPLTLTGIGPQSSHVVAEVGTNSPGEIAHLGGLIDPEVSVITNVGFAHLGNFTGQQELAVEKTDLFRQTRPGGVWIFNGDDELLSATTRAIPAAAQAQLVTVGFEPGNDIRAVDIVVDERGTSGLIEVDGEAIAFWLAAAGRHFAYAAMFAVAVGRVYSIAPAEAIEALRGIAPPPGRASLRRIDDHLLMIDDSYNGSPDAMISSLDLLESLPGALKIAVLGEMRELGSFSAQLHERVGRAAAAKATHLITVGAAAGPLRASAAAAGLAADRITTADSAREAQLQVRQLISAARSAADTAEDVVVLAKGSRFMHMERVFIGLSGHTVNCGLSVCTLYINCRDCPKLEAAQ
jgi:UDP-N-acetylmuramoyl-tripeptide--D-alanyl-D-alanine ligase